MAEFGLRGRQIAVVLAVSAVTLLTNLGGPRLWDRDEPRNAACAREMLDRGDWIVPTFNGELRAHKPVLLYWAIMSAYSVFGVSEFAARLPSALFAIGTTLCTWFLGRRLFGGQVGVWAAIALTTSLMFCVAGRAATPDSALVFCTTLALAIYVAGTFQPRDDAAPDEPPRLRVPGCYFPQHFLTVSALYAAMGLGVLAKGPLGFLIPTAVIGLYLLIVRSSPHETPPASLRERLVRCLQPLAPLHFLRTCGAMRPLIALISVAAVALPWYLAVDWATEGEFVRRFIWEHNLERATRPMEGHSGGTLWYYPLVLLVGFFPFSIFALPAALDVRAQFQQRSDRPLGLIFALCWIGVVVGAFSLAQTKLPSYVTPCYPALALIAGAFVDRWSRGAATGWRGWVPFTFACLVIDGVLIASITPLLLRHFLPGEQVLGLLGLPLALGGVICLAWTFGRNRRAAVVSFAGSAVAFATLLFAFGAQRVNDRLSNAPIVAAAQNLNLAVTPQLAAVLTLEPSWVFYAGQPIVHLVTPKRGEGVPHDTLIRNYFASQPEGMIILSSKEYDALAPQLPQELCVLADAPRVIQQDRWVLIGRPRHVVVARAE